MTRTGIPSALIFSGVVFLLIVLSVPGILNQTSNSTTLNISRINNTPIDDIEKEGTGNIAGFMPEDWNELSELTQK